MGHLFEELLRSLLGPQKKLPERLRSFFLANYQPLDERLWLWGRRYRIPAGCRLEADFFAVWDGR